MIYNDLTLALLNRITKLRQECNLQCFQCSYTIWVLNLQLESYVKL